MQRDTSPQYNKLMSSRDEYDNLRLERLRQWRTRPERDLSMKFLQKHFKRDIEKPYKQLGDLTELWYRLIPADLLPHTRLERLQRGVLYVGVESSSHLYELTHLLRGGVEQQLIQHHRGSALRRIKLELSRSSQSTDL